MIGYVIDTYNPRNRKDVECTVFSTTNGAIRIGIKKVPIVDGLPQLPYLPIDSELDMSWFKVYETLDEAKQYLRMLKRI